MVKYWNADTEEIGKNKIQKPGTEDLLTEDLDRCGEGNPFSQNVSKRATASAMGSAYADNLPERFGLTWILLAAFFRLLDGFLRAKTTSFEISVQRYRASIEGGQGPNDIHYPHLLGMSEEVQRDHDERDGRHRERRNRK